MKGWFSTTLAALALVVVGGCKSPGGEGRSRPGASAGRQGPQQTSGPKGGKVEKVLPQTVGDQLNRILKSEAFKQALPPGFSIDGIRVEQDKILVSLSSEAGKAKVVLLAKDMPSARKGKFFGYRFEGGDEAALEKVARAIDTGFENSPWELPKKDNPVPRRPSGNPEAARGPQQAGSPSSPAQ